MGLMGGGSSEFSFKFLIFSLAIMLLLPMFLMIYAPATYLGATEDEVLEGYSRMTGQAADTKVSVWPLTGIYTPFTGGFVDGDQTITYGYTEDGWLYGTSVGAYTPSQYQSTDQQYTVYKADDGVFRYLYDSKDYNEEYGTGHKGRVMDGDTVEYPGDLYSEVTMDITQMSNIFFVESSRAEDASGHFYYEYSGYRYAFQPISNYTAMNADGNKIPVVATTTSLSLVWYQYLSQSGITGQMVLSGSNGGIAYINSAQILSAFNGATNVAEFDMVFNGVTMNIYVKIDPMATSTGQMTVEQAYNAGLWSIMVTSLSVDSSAYTGTDYANNPMQLFETMIDLLTFNMDDYDISPWLSALCSILFVAPLYVGLISLCLDNAYLWILVGLLAALQSLSFLPW